MLAWLCASGQDNGCEGDEGGGANKVLHRILARIFLIIVLVGGEIKVWGILCPGVDF